MSTQASIYTIHALFYVYFSVSISFCIVMHCHLYHTWAHKGAHGRAAALAHAGVCAAPVLGTTVSHSIGCYTSVLQVMPYVHELRQAETVPITV